MAWYLSKSRFAAGLQCHRLLWWRVREPDAPELIPGIADQAVFDQGSLVGKLARAYVPGGQLVDLPHDAFDERAAATRTLLERGVPVIYEASFSADNVYVAADILERARDGLHLIEVKSSTKLKEEHLPDIAIQLYVLRRCGVHVSRAELMHLNRECAYPHLEDLFVREDVTAAAEAWQAGLPPEIAAQMVMLNGDLPDTAPGAHCNQPYDCPFFSRCSQVLPPHHVSTLYRVRSKGFDLIAQGIDTIYQLPAAGLSAVQERQKRAVQTGRLIVELGLAQALRDFCEPLTFLDFETVALAIPVWDGCHPYDAIPVQFSCHHLGLDGSVTHDEWLAEGPGDPRPELARRLVAACRGGGSIVAYNASFERGRIDLLAAAVPELTGELASIRSRIVDLLPVLRDHVYHPDFVGSFSLKAVLPALVPGPGHEELDVAEGAVASVEIERLMFGGDGMEAGEREARRAALLRYCALDTLSLLKLLQRLTELAGTA